MDFVSDFFSFKSFYAISAGIVWVLTLTMLIYRLSMRKIKPIYSGIVIALLVSLMHLLMSGVPYNSEKILTGIIQSILIYTGAISLAGGIAGITRSIDSSNQKERDMVFGGENK